MSYDVEESNHEILSNCSNDSFEWTDDSLKDSEVHIDRLDFEKVEDDIEKHIQCPDCNYRIDRQSNFNRHCKITHNIIRFPVIFVISIFRIDAHLLDI